MSKKDFGTRLFIQSLGYQGSEFLESYKSGGKRPNTDINKIIEKVEIGMKVMTKGSLFQYLYFFPDDAFLNFWAGLISQEDKKVLKKQHFSMPKTVKEYFEKATRINKKNEEFEEYLKQSKKE